MEDGPFITEADIEEKRRRVLASPSLGRSALAELRVFWRTIFPRVPSDKEVAERNKANARRVVMLTSQDSDDYLLTVGRYLTAEDMEEKRQRVINGGE